MGVTGTFFLCAGSEESGVIDGPPPGSPQVDSRSITPLEAGGIYAVLLGDGDPLELMDLFEPLSPEEEGESWTYRVPAGMVERLVEIDPAGVDTLAEECARTTAEELDWPAAAFVSLLGELSTLAGRARAGGLEMFLHVSL